MNAILFLAVGFAPSAEPPAIKGPPVIRGFVPAVPAPAVPASPAPIGSMPGFDWRYLPNVGWGWVQQPMAVTQTGVAPSPFRQGETATGAPRVAAPSIGFTGATATGTATSAPWTAQYGLTNPFGGPSAGGCPPSG